MVISIIVMLILAGVSINAIIGDDGIISRTQYSTFLSEMTAVEEAVQMWKAGEVIGQMGEETKAIPANGICKVEDLTSTDRLAGEVGYYRIWSMTETVPTTSIFSDSDEFNSTFEGEMIYYPAGVQDLFYLNNEVLGIESDKTYVIDIATGMIYSMAGVKLKGISCYSANMATAVMSGQLNAPVFAESEVSGTGTDDKLAGNVQDEFLEDGTKNPDYNPYGFQIIADISNENVYKLYNNGDLYGKGVKGYKLNSSTEEIDKMDTTKWQSRSIPSEIPGSSTNDVQIIVGSGNVFAIDNQGYLWAWGGNASNVMGLKNDELIEFSQYQVKKLNVDGKKVSKIFPLTWATFVITQDNQLYASGCNNDGELGTGTQEPQTDGFKKINFPENVNNIKEIYDNFNGLDNVNPNFGMILTNTGKLYFAGCREGNKSKNIKFTKTIPEGDVNNWTEVDTQVMFPGLDFTKVKGIGRCNNYNWQRVNFFFYEGNKCFCLDGYGNAKEIKPWGDDCISIEFQDGGSTGHIVKITKSTGIEWYARHWSSATMFITSAVNVWENITDTIKEVENANNSNVSKFWTNTDCIIIVLENGKVYGYGNSENLGIGESIGKVEFTEIKELSFMNGNFELPKCDRSLILKYDNKLYGANNSVLVLGDKILQKGWAKILSDVKYFNASTNGDSFAVIKNDDCLYVRGNQSRVLGVNQEVGSIKDLTKITGEGSTEEAKLAINSGIKKYAFCGDALYILTKNNTLLVTNYCPSNAYYGDGYVGIEPARTSNFAFTIVQNEVEDFYCSGRWKISKKNDGIYFWGSANGGSMKQSATPIKIDEIWNNTGNLKSVLLSNWNNIWMVGENNTVTDGICKSGTIVCSGRGNTSDNSPAVLTAPEKIVSAVYNNSFLCLGDKGTIYGAGMCAYLGEGTEGMSNKYNGILHEVKTGEKFIQLVGGNGFAIAITEDGKVFGTGSNTNGILGRWIGIDRKQPNSRYKTAYDWVECPELEL